MNCFLDVWLNGVASEREGNQALHLGHELDQLLTKVSLRLPENIISKRAIAICRTADVKKLMQCCQVVLLKYGFIKSTHFNFFLLLQPPIFQ